MSIKDFAPFIQIGLLPLLLLACSSNKNPKPHLLPAACLTMPQTATRNIMVAFDGSCSKNSNSYLWDFEDGQTSDQQNPTHVFMIDIQYTVKLGPEYQAGALINNGFSVWKNT